MGPNPDPLFFFNSGFSCGLDSDSFFFSRDGFGSGQSRSGSVTFNATAGSKNFRGSIFFFTLRWTVNMNFREEKTLSLIIGVFFLGKYKISNYLPKM